MIVLYEFAISHFCEKIRWALDYKQLDYRKETLIPGAHVLTTKKLSTSSNVPILKDGDHVVQNSQDILTYLDTAYPEHPLTPSDPEHAKEAIAWEQYVDKEIGIHLRRAAYHILLDHPKVLVPIFCQDKPRYTRWLMRPAFGVLSSLMRKSMNINAESAMRSADRLRSALEQLSEAYQNGPYLVSDTFTRADLAAAALLAPLEMSERYGTGFESTPPQAYQEFAKEFSELASPSLRLYNALR